MRRPVGAAGRGEDSRADAAMARQGLRTSNRMTGIAVDTGWVRTPARKRQQLPWVFRRLRIRWEFRDDIHEAFLSLAGAIIC